MHLIYVKTEWCSRALEKSADSFSEITYRFFRHIIYIFLKIMEVTFAKEYSAILKDLLHYLCKIKGGLIICQIISKNNL